LSKEGLSTEERVLEWTSFILLIASFVYTVLHDVGFQISILEPYYLLIVMTLFVFGIAGIFFIVTRKNKMKTTIGNPIFAHLVIHLSDRLDTPDSPQLHNPRYVSYKSQAYWIDDEIGLHFRQHEIARWLSYDGEKKLQKSLGIQGIHINDKYPSVEDLGLWHKPDGSLMLAVDPFEQDVMLKLQERKRKGELKQYELALIYPWHCARRKWLNSFFPSDKRLLLNHDTHIACPPPEGHMRLWHDNLIHWDTYRKWVPYERSGLWCWFHGFKFSREPCDISELTGEQTQR
jgi:hypothetical protein